MTDLSLSAHKILDAACCEIDYIPVGHVRYCVAATLRAAAVYCKRDKLILLNFADELENQ